MKKIIIIATLLAAILLLNGCKSENTVTIFSSMEDFRNEDLKNVLDEKIS